VTRLVLVRHGETVWHAENRYAGSTDVALSQHGHDQADQLAGWATTAGLSALWTSPLSRARNTATAVALATGLEARADDRLRELDFGRGEGHTAAEMRTLFPEAMAAFVADPVGAHLPGGEDPRAAVARALACLEDITSDAPDGRVLIVTHTTLLRLVLCRLLGLPMSDYRRRFPLVRNCALTEIRLDGLRTALLQFNSPVERLASG
jgi:broad specificity phosphatase PhoE